MKNVPVGLLLAEQKPSTTSFSVESKNMEKKMNNINNVSNIKDLVITRDPKTTKIDFTEEFKESFEGFINEKLILIEVFLADNSKYFLKCLFLEEGYIWDNPEETIYYFDLEKNLDIHNNLSVEWIVEYICSYLSIEKIIVDTNLGCDLLNPTLTHYLLAKAAGENL
jgi:hypothetical protein